jgi:hypothetical protein
MNHTDRARFLPKDAVKWVAGSGLVLLAGAVALSADFRSLLWSGWPFLILLLCPLMHVFMMRGGHGGSGHHGGDETAPPSKTNRGSLDHPRERWNNTVDSNHEEAGWRFRAGLSWLNYW